MRFDSKIPDNWCFKSLGDRCLSITSGGTPSRSESSFFVGADGIPWVKTKELNNGFIYDTEEHLSEEALHCSSAKINPARSVLIAMYGATVGELGILASPMACNQACCSLFANPETDDERFIFYQLLYFKQSIKNQAVGAAQQNISSKFVKSLELPVPPLSEQKAIARILGTIDEKIELNRQINCALEEMAKTLFKSWFVDFDPVRAKVEGRQTHLPKDIDELFTDSFDDSEFGEIPSGWRVVELSTLCEFISSGGTPSRKNLSFWESGTIKWFKTGELRDSFVIESDEHITSDGLKHSSCKLFSSGDILFALYGATVGKIGVVTSPSTSNQAAACLRPLDKVGTPFLEFLLYETRGRLMNIATGAAQQNLYLKDIRQHLIVSPSFDLTKVFSDIISPVNNRRLQCLCQVNTLQLLRDALLPRLVTGELRVPDAEKIFDEVVV